MAAPLLAALIFRDAIATGLTFEASRNVWVVYAGAMLSIFLATLRRNRIEFPSAGALLTVRTPGLLIIPALLFANGLMPYLGLKTETSFAMYSNLRTEGGYSNHWLLPASLQIWDYQRDLVKIHRTSVPAHPAPCEPRLSMDVLRIQMADARIPECVGRLRAERRRQAGAARR